MFSNVLNEALSLPEGARFYRCSFQVNPYAYLLRHAKPTPFGDEASYNAALVAALQQAGIEAIAVTDHFRIAESVSLMDAARAAGIVVFPGFEASLTQGVHLLCLFDPSADTASVQACINSCGIHGVTDPSPMSDMTVQQLLEKCAPWGMQCIAPHVTQANGLLQAMQGQARINVWKHDCLVACAIPGPIRDLPQGFRVIVDGTNPDYRRSRAIAILNAADVCTPDDAAKPSSSCLVKMTDVTLEGLRQAFLDPDSRVRLNSDERPQEHPEILGIAWETAGFLQGCRIRLNENLNVLVGGRGNGKSTIIESLRYALDVTPVGEDAKAAHNAMVKGVLASGTKVSVAVQSYQPDRRTFVVERTYPNPPQVRDGQSGDVLSLTPADVLPGVTILGQNEISELARQPSRLLDLLSRFTAPEAAAGPQSRRVQDALVSSRRQLTELLERMQRLDDELAALPGIEEKLARFRAAGVEERLGAQALIVREEGLVASAAEALNPFRELFASLDALLPLDVAALSDDRLEGLPTAAVLRALRVALLGFATKVGSAADGLRVALAEAEAQVAVARTGVDATKAAAQAEYDRVLRELLKDHKVDGGEFMRLRKEVERLMPMREARARLDSQVTQVRGERRNQLAEWEDLKRARLERFQRAARGLGRALDGKLRLTVRGAGDRTVLLETLRSVGGRLNEAATALQDRDDVSVSGLAAAIREGHQALVRAFGFVPAQAQRLAEAGEALAMRVEELDLPPGTSVELNVAREGGPPDWRPLAGLSVGQKATAMLHLLLIESNAPLIIDQPEDNLDNRFISEGIVPAIRSGKLGRQFVFASHNANIPVLGDAEMIVGLTTTGAGGDLHVEAVPSRMGAIDCLTVRAVVEEVLEGGKDAFMIRRRKYGF
ncbi:MAG: hypothetical protein KIC89_21725 [Acetobacteraceae bacterium]|nr:hypothetical protein [Acetobacteraceae bacterium]